VQLLEKNEALPQLIISDIMMPVMDGFALLEKLKATEAWRKIPVIMLTARADIQDKLAALRIGVDDYLVKPFVTEELTARMNNLLERHHARNNAEWVQAAEDEGTDDDTTPLPETPVSPPRLQQLEAVITDYLDRQENFTLDALAEKINISKRQLQRNIKEETGMTANSYIREMRLHRARLYLEAKTFATITELSYAVGFNDPHYFSTLFAERYGKRPGEYL
jgi:YesN/AraC family two-component response regulator